MDPTACLLDLLNALEDEDRDTAIEKCNDLAGWLAGGGFFPDAGEVADEFLEIVEQDDDDN